MQGVAQRVGAILSGEPGAEPRHRISPTEGAGLVMGLLALVVYAVLRCWCGAPCRCLMHQAWARCSAGSSLRGVLCCLQSPGHPVCSHLLSLPPLWPQGMVLQGRPAGTSPTCCAR